MTRTRLLLGGAAALLCAVALGVLMHAAGSPIVQADQAWNELMVSTRTSPTVGAALTLDVVGGGAASVIVALALAVVLTFVRGWRTACFVLIASLASVGCVQLMKHIFGRARPEDLLVPSDYGSFPSGHTANAATLAVIVVLVVPRLWSLIVGALWVVAMAYSRTTLSVHWLSDTIAGVLIGAGVVLIVAGMLLPWVRARSAAEVTAPFDRRAGTG